MVILIPVAFISFLFLQTWVKLFVRFTILSSFFSKICQALYILVLSLSFFSLSPCLYFADAIESLRQSCEFVCPNDGFLDQVTQGSSLLTLAKR